MPVASTKHLRPITDAGAVIHQHRPCLVVFRHHPQVARPPRAVCQKECERIYDSFSIPIGSIYDLCVGLALQRRPNLMLDQAGWHMTDKLAVPENIDSLPIVRYSSEIERNSANPVHERPHLIGLLEQAHRRILLSDALPHTRRQTWSILAAPKCYRVGCVRWSINGCYFLSIRS